MTPSHGAPPPHQSNGSDATEKPSPLNVPNALCAVRVGGAAVLLVLAYGGRDAAFLWLLVVLLVTDWIDGKLARLLRQRTSLGAVLDSVADASMYGALGLGLYWLRPLLFEGEIGWIAAVIASYVLTVAVGFARFRRLPSYHTRAAKAGWLFISVGALLFFLFENHWPLRAALAFVILTNLEATAISLLLRQWQTDVPSLYHAVKIRRR